jgi:cyclopropane-fatty-acyl-phospholipid synthase
MTRSRLEPLGVPAGGHDYDDSDNSAPRREPRAWDRWLVARLMDRLSGDPVVIDLWDAPRNPPADEKVHVRVRDRRALYQLLVNPELHFGDLYSAGRLEVNGDLLTVLRAAYRYTQSLTPFTRMLFNGKRMATPDLSDSKRNIHHHYDIGNEFYRLWLDREALQYTCAYFPREAMTIEQAQLAKMHLVCRKLKLQPGETVVEAGGGWGGFALFMARNYGAKVRSFNISKEQIAHARDWAKQLGLQNQVEFVEDDYRNTTGEYDAFVSIGMLEHVGVGNYRELGRLMSRSIKRDGRGLVHTIGRDRPAPLNAWIDKRIFPGAYPPTLRQMMDLFEPVDLSVLDVENLRLHYAKTCSAWLERYEENVEKVRSLFDEAFVRAWRLYLAGSIAAFQSGSLQLFQVLYARTGRNTLRWSRADIYAPGE